MNISRLILIAIMLTVSTPTIAEQGDFWLNIHIGSSHSEAGYYDSTKSWEGEANNESTYTLYNESNPGIGLTYELTNVLDLRAGGYYNSHYSASVYGGGSLHTSFSNVIAAGIIVGAVTGYEDVTGSPISLMALPYVSINTKYARVEVSYLPAYGEDTHSVVGLTATVVF